MKCQKCGLSFVETQTFGTPEAAYRAHLPTCSLQGRITAQIVELAPMIALKVDGDVWELSKADAHRVMCALMGVLGYSEDYLIKRGYQPKEALGILKIFWDSAP